MRRDALRDVDVSKLAAALAAELKPLITPLHQLRQGNGFDSFDSGIPEISQKGLVERYPILSVRTLAFWRRSGKIPAGVLDPEVEGRVRRGRWWTQLEVQQIVRYANSRLKVGK